MSSTIKARGTVSGCRNRDTAIIMSPSVTVKSTPTSSGTDLFIIHEGRKVQILDSSMKEWVEIRLEDGNTGWVPVNVMEII
jgi:SH3-like domain-containing protein